MGAEIDRLELVIEAESSKANSSLENLAKKLDKISTLLGGISEKKLTELANGIENISKSNTKLAGVNSGSFTRLANGLVKLGGISTGSTLKTAVNIRILATSLNKIGSVSQNAKDFGNVSNNISKLGSKGVENAIANIPKLTTSLNQMMITLSKAPAVSQNLISITNALAGLSNSLKGVSTASVATAKTSNGLKTVSNALSVLSVKTNKASKSFHTFSQMAGKFYANTFLIIRSVKSLWKAIGSSMDYTETFNYWNVAFDKIGKEFGSQFEQYGYDNADSYAKSFRNRIEDTTKKMTGYQIGEKGDLTLTGDKNLGIDPERLMNYQAKISSVTNAVGLCGETSTNTSKALSMLAADMSSFTNKDLSQVMTNFQSGLIGQSRAMYQYGIDITNANLQQYAYNLGLSKSVTAMTQAEKMQLRLIAILEQSKVAWGDQANTLSSVANQYRILKQQISNLTRTIGNLFLPIIKTVLPFVNGLTMAITRLLNMLGFKIHGDNWLKDLQDGASKGFSDDALADLGDSADDAANSLEDANNAAKKLKTTTLGIDELNINAPESDTGKGNASLGGGGVDLSGAIGDALEEYESVWDKAFANAENKAQEFADRICKFFQRIADATRPFQEAISRLWNSGLSKFADFIWTALKDFYNGFLVPIGNWAFGTEDSGLTRLVNIINDSLLAINWNKLNTSLRNFWIAIEPYAEQFGEGLIDFFEKVSGIAVDVTNGIPGFLDKLTEALNNGNPESARLLGYGIGVLTTAIGGLKIINSVFTEVATFINLIKNSILVKVISSAIGGIKGIISAIGVLKSGGLLEATNIFSKFANAIALTAGGAGTFGEALQACFSKFNGFAAVISGVVMAVSNFISMFQNGFNIVKEILMVIGTVIAAVGAIILFHIPAGIAAAVAAVVSAIATVVILVKDNWNEICSFFAGIGEWINTNVIQPVIGFFKGLWEKVSGFFSNLRTDIYNIWNTVSTWFSTNVIEPVVSFFQGFQKRVHQVFEGLWIIVQAVWKVASTWFNENIITPIVTLFQSVWENVSLFFTNLWNDIVVIWEKVSTWFNDTVIIPITTFFKGVWENVSGYFIELWNGIKIVWQKVASWFNTTVIKPLIGFFDGLWDGIKFGMVSAMNAVIGGIEKAINWIVDGINKIIGGFNKVVSWAAKIAEVDWGGVDLVPNVQFSRIEMFANGGFPETGELFMARENGINEMVGRIGSRSAVTNNDQIVAGITAGVASANEEQNALLREQNHLLMQILEKGFSAIVNIDGREMVSAYDDRKQRNGYALT